MWKGKVDLWSTRRRQWHPTPVLLPGKIPWMEEPGRLQSMGSLRVRHDWTTSLSLFTFMHWRRKWQPTPVFLPGESQGRESLVGCHLWGHTESGMIEVSWRQPLTQNMFLIGRNRKQRSMDLTTGWIPLIYQEEVISYSSEFEWHLYFFPFFRPKFMQLIIKSTLLSKVWLVFCL